MDNRNSFPAELFSDYFDPQIDAANLNQIDPNINNHSDDGSSICDTDGDNDGHDIRKDLPWLHEKNMLVI